MHQNMQWDESGGHNSFLLSPLTFSRMYKLQLCRQDSVYYLHCNAFQCHFYYRPLPSPYLSSIYCFLWFKISKNSSVQFQSALLVGVSLELSRETSLTTFLGLRYENSYSLGNNSNSCYCNQDHDFKTYCILVI
jgi:hypothetical protein